MKLSEKLTQPSSLSDTVGDRMVFSLGAGPRDGGLPLRRPGDEAGTEEDGVTGGGPPGVRAAGPIGISVDNELRGGGARDDKTIVDGALKIAEDPLSCSKMSLPRIVHVQADLLDCIGDVGAGEGEVLKSTRKAAVCSGIVHRGAGVSGDLGTCVNWGGAGLAAAHAMSIKDIQGVLSL